MRASLQEPVSVQGIWLRTRDGKAEVLAEIAGEWRLVIASTLHDGAESIISHIVEPSGIRSSPPDERSAA